MANISGTDQAIDKWKTALSTTIFPTLHENNLVNFGGPLRKKWPWPLTLKFNRFLKVVEVRVCAKFHQAECRVIMVTNFSCRMAKNSNNRSSDLDIMTLKFSGFVRLPRYVFVQNFIERCAAFHALSCSFFLLSSLPGGLLAQRWGLTWLAQCATRIFKIS